MSEITLTEVIVTHVEPGETLSEIADRYDVSLDALLRWNRIDNPDLVLVGQRIVIHTTGDLPGSFAFEWATRPVPGPDVVEGFWGALIGAGVVLGILLLLYRLVRKAEVTDDDGNHVSVQEVKCAALDASEYDRWHRTLARHQETLRSVHGRLTAFADPARYLTTEALHDLEAEAQTVAGRFAARWPDALSDTPGVRMLRDILKFLEAPGDARAKANEAFVANELARSREFFDQIEARPLTEEQRRAVVIDGRRNLVVAAAGSGKTSVIVAKTGWLVRKGYRKPSELLLLAFARDACREMEERLDTRLGTAMAQDVTVRTFHSLGMKIVGETEGKRPALAATAENERALLDLLKGIVADLLAERDLSAMLDEWFQEGFAPYRSQQEFRTWGEYYDYIRKFDIRSLKGEVVRSFEECEIANFLYLHGVDYEYEAPYEHDLATSEKRQYKPDFRLPEHGIYIEHFGINANGNPAPFIDREQYWRVMEWKRGVHAEHDTVLIETFSHEQTDGRLLRNLTEKLEAHGVTLSPIPREEIFAALDRQGRIDPFTRLVATFLQHFKGSRLSFEEVASRATARRDRKRAHAFLAVFRAIFERYEKALASAGEIDFHDMINRATDLVEEGRYRCPFGYILVDEFQDISPSRLRLLKVLLDRSSGAQLFAVGDDWQAIYRFSGSDIAVMREFGDHFGAFERIDLATTFRCADRIAAAATKFVLRNPAQIRKTVRTTRAADRPAVYIGLPGEQELSLLKEALDRIAEDARRHDGTSEVLLLGRYRHLAPRNPGTLREQYPGLRFTWMTVHRSKGLEADYAVVIGLCSGKYGFPAEIADDPLLDLVLAAPEAHPNAEERRLLYVAVTRARRQVFLLADGGPPSEFVMELINGRYDVEVFGRPPEGDVSCPRCTGGRLVRRENARSGGVFYGCSNFPLCEHTARPCPHCGDGLPVKSGEAFRCRDCGGAIEACPVCDGWLNAKMGKYGRFLGCSNFPGCEYTRNLQKS
ncbi:MAG: UvrD-helicase domain-containing protein [Rhodospirillales bacterium]|nr:UvrD-helicase domain-containing protein [Rhodospirillales bacterium]